MASSNIFQWKGCFPLIFKSLKVSNSKRKLPPSSQRLPASQLPKKKTIFDLALPIAILPYAVTKIETIGKERFWPNVTERLKIIGRKDQKSLTKEPQK
jgi:hypothetical protein